MRDLRIPAALIFTSSLFLVHCSSAEDPPANNSGSSGTASGSAGTTTGGAGKSGAGGGAGVAGTGGSMGGTSGATSGAGKGGLGGSAGQSSGGAGTTGAGAGGRSMAGGAGMSAGGMAGAGAGMGGQSGNGGGMAGTGAGMGGKAGGGVGGSSSGAMTLTSTVITEGGIFPDLNTCAGDNKSPDLTWTAGPTGTMSYAVVLLDTSNMLNHWAIWDIPSTVTTLPAMLDSMAMPATPAGAKQKSFQANAYYGPCPSGADHIYKFTVYAMPVASVPGATTSEMPNAIVMDIMAANPLGSASLSAHSTASMN